MKTFLNSVSIGFGVSNGVILAIATAIFALCLSCLICTSLVIGDASTQLLVTTPVAPTKESFVPDAAQAPASTRTPRPANTPRPTSTPVFGSSQSPVPFGETALITSSGLDETQVSIRVLSLTRGQGAWDIVYESNMFNDPPQEGLEYAVLEVLVGYVMGSESFMVSNYDFGVLSNKRVLDFTFSGCCTDGLELVEGGEGVLTLFMQAYGNDTDPLLIYQPLFSGNKFYFKTK